MYTSADPRCPPTSSRPPGPVLDLRSYPRGDHPDEGNARFAKMPNARSISRLRRWWLGGISLAGPSGCRGRGSSSFGARRPRARHRDPASIDPVSGHGRGHRIPVDLGVLVTISGTPRPSARTATGAAGPRRHHPAGARDDRGSVSAPGRPSEPNHQTTEKGPIVSNLELPVSRKHAIDGGRRLRRVVPLRALTSPDRCRRPRSIPAPGRPGPARSPAVCRVAGHCRPGWPR